jgi:hypothetical protein
MQQQITITVDTDRLSGLTDSHLATLWHVAQANPAPHGDHDAGTIAEAIGREIIARFLRTTHAELYHHQGSDHYWHALIKHCICIDGQWQPKPQRPHAIVIYGEQGSGKSRHADKLLAHFGKSVLVDDWDGVSALPPDALALTSEHPNRAYLRLEEALHDAGIEDTAA